MKTIKTVTEYEYDDQGRPSKETVTVTESETPLASGGLLPKRTPQPNGWWHPSFGPPEFPYTINSKNSGSGLAPVLDLTSKIADAATTKAVKGITQDGGYL